MALHHSRKLKAVMGLCIAGYVLWVLIPAGNLVLTTFKLPREVMTGPYSYFPQSGWIMKNYSDIWNVIPLGKYLFNSLFISSATMFFSVILSVLAGYGISRFTFRGRKGFIGFVLLTQSFPGILFLMPYFLLYIQLESLTGLHLRGTYASLIITYTTFALPFCMMLMKSYFESIPVDIEEAAMIDGCSQFGAFLRIVLPAIRPAIATVGILGFLQAWNDVLFASVLTNEFTRTVAVGITDYASQFEVQWNYVLTAGVVISLPVVIFFVFLQKHIIQGLTAGAVKG
ncbi:MAG: carbohydrate ABC transporter permease [Spirochaetia bacterium]|nr:carbohydrate ABC transporter permease [Spirochaetia bacterium]